MKYFFTIFAIFLGNTLFAKDIDELIKDLGDESYITRSFADESLRSIGLRAYKKIEEASSHKDPEVRLRATSILRDLKIAKVWLGSQVDCSHKRHSVGEWLSEIEKQTGNRVNLEDNYGAGEDVPDLLLKSGNFWEVLDQLCRKSNNKFRPSYSDNTLSLAMGKMPVWPISYNGPFFCTIPSAYRSYSQDITYDENLKNEATHTFRLTFDIYWESQLQLIQYSTPVVDKIITDTGEELRGPGPNTGEITPGRENKFSVNINCTPPSFACRSFKSVLLKVPVIVGCDRQEYEIVNPNSEKTYYHNDLEISFNETNGFRMTVVRDLEMFQNEMQVKFLDDEGVEKNVSTSYDSDGLHFSNSQKPAKVILRYPLLRSRKTVDFLFSDVPLPLKGS